MPPSLLFYTRRRSDVQRRFGGIVGALKLRPQSVLCVPCGDRESVLGVLVVLDKQGGVLFSFYDVEIATLLAGIAGVALAASGRPAAAPSPQELSAGLERLAAADPAQYAAVAALVSAIWATAANVREAPRPAGRLSQTISTRSVSARATLFAREAEGRHSTSRGM